MNNDHRNVVMRVEQIIDSLLDNNAPIPGHFSDLERGLVADIQSAALPLIGGRQMLRDYRDTMRGRLAAGEPIQRYTDFARRAKSSKSLRPVVGASRANPD